ncbi:MAG: glycosyltransferase family 2 protein [Nanoarchaeota archaeon]
MKIDKSLKNKVFFVIPAYNEERSIGKVIDLLISNNYENLIIINDGSYDFTSKIVADKIQKIQNNNIVLLEHVINRGQGASLKTGIDFARSIESCKYIVTFDSDGQHRISDLPKFLKALENDECDIAIGSRFLNKETKQLVPLKKRILLKGALLITLFLSNINLTDTHNGYRVIKKSIANELNITLDGFEHASEILDDISKKGIRYKEIPVFIDYTNYSQAKGQKMSNSVKILLKMLFKSNK